MAALGATHFRPARPTFRPATLVLLPFAILYSIVALAPEIGPDATTYHLAVPAHWVQSGEFFSPAGHYETMPHAIELFFAAAGRSAKLVHFGLFLAIVPMMLAVGRRLSIDAEPGACLFFFIPVAGVCATSAYVDLALTFFALATFYFAAEERPAWSGAMAGLCYAVKMTGVAAAPAVVGYWLFRKRWRDAAYALAACTITMAPWIGRAWWMAGNPFAPLLNEWFPNPFFHPGTEDELRQYVASYGVPWREMALELTVGGERANGLLGPAMLAAPLALIALRSPAGRALWIAAAVASVPWWFNHGTRFLLPAMPFVCLASSAALPRKAVWALAVFQGIACWPSVMDRWVGPAAWRIRDIPLAAAFRQEPAAEYLSRVSPEFRIADFVRKNTPGRARILDLVGIASAYAERPVFNHWQYAGAERAADAIRVAALAGRGAFRQLQALWAARPLTAVRVELMGAGKENWAIQEIELLHRGRAIHPSRDWELDADPNPWETPLLLDRNPASRWQSWRPAQARMFVEVAFPLAVECDGIRILGWRDDSMPVRLLGRDVKGTWALLTASPDRRLAPELSLRKWAVRYARREGFGWVVVHSNVSAAGDSPWGKVGRELTEHPGDWGLRMVGSESGVALMELTDGGPGR